MFKGITFQIIEMFEDNYFSDYQIVWRLSFSDYDHFEDINNFVDEVFSNKYFVCETFHEAHLQMEELSPTPLHFP